ncbi:MAG: DUF2156 domain-containing protein [Clostridiales bacterium]|nr:DUF2156 domain-containing protein [Candidatus Crickella caballi]
MIEWKDIKIEDKKLIDEFICASGCHGADYSFANLYMWRKAYEPKIHFAGDRLLVYMPQWSVYAYPKGGGDVRPSMDLLFEDAHSKGQKLFLRGLTERTLSEFMPLYGDRFEISEDRDNADYIYTTDKLCNLQGRKLASKRNHIHKFERNGEWELRPVKSNAAETSEATLEEAKTFVQEFYLEKHDPELAEEAIAINEMFANYDELGFRAALLYQKGEPVAFSAGTKLDDKVFDVHFEKALPGVDGAYTMINREFTRMIAAEFPGIEAFNREEDMGLEGLRKAKESYHPDVLLMKYYAKEK